MMTMATEAIKNDPVMVAFTTLFEEIQENIETTGE